MKNRTIQQVIPAQRVNMGGHLLDQPLPNASMKHLDPFLLIHHWNHPIKGNYKQQEVGVGPHPHRGFSPVTFIFKGDIQHQDSLGNNIIVEEGGTQWMHAGKGITHSERPSQKLSEEGGEHEFIQFWVNTPAQYKMEIPYYLPLSDKQTPKVIQKGAEIGVVAGEFENIKGPAKTYSPQTLLRVNAEENGHISLSLPQHYNVLIYILSGKIQIGNRVAKSKDMVIFNHEEGSIEIDVLAETRLIVLSGEPIQEKITSYGPFVMNTQTEIMEALRDAQTGKMGVLIEEFK